MTALPPRPAVRPCGFTQALDKTHVSIYGTRVASTALRKVAPVTTPSSVEATQCESSCSVLLGAALIGLGVTRRRRARFVLAAGPWPNSARLAMRTHWPSGVSVAALLTRAGIAEAAVVGPPTPTSTDWQSNGGSWTAGSWSNGAPGSGDIVWLTGTGASRASAERTAPEQRQAASERGGETAECTALHPPYGHRRSSPGGRGLRRVAKRRASRCIALSPRISAARNLCRAERRPR